MITSKIWLSELSPKLFIFLKSRSPNDQRLGAKLIFSFSAKPRLMKSREKVTREFDDVT